MPDPVKASEAEFLRLTCPKGNAAQIAAMSSDVATTAAIGSQVIDQRKCLGLSGTGSSLRSRPRDPIKQTVAKRQDLL